MFLENAYVLPTIQNVIKTLIYSEEQFVRCSNRGRETAVDL